MDVFKCMLYHVYDDLRKWSHRRQVQHCIDEIMVTSLKVGFRFCKIILVK